MTKLDDVFSQFDSDPTFDSPTTSFSETLGGRAFDRPERKPFADALTARQFITAGRATVTLESLKTKKRFTYKVSVATDRDTGKPSGDGTLFVGLLNGPDNETAYKYMGRISRDIFWRGRKTPRPGDISKDAPSMVAFDWAWRALLQNTIPATLNIWHEGCCGRCGRKLTVPESIKSGFGPECITKVG